MSGGKDKISIFPSRGNFAIMKVRLKSAVQGHQLLETKVDALEVRFRRSMKTLIRVRLAMGRLARDCFFALAESKFHLAPCMLGQTVLTTAGQQGAQLTITTNAENVAGVRLPHFVINDSQKDIYSTLGLARGGIKVRQAKDAFRHFLDNLVQLATLETTFRQLEEVIKVTKRRVHALENVLIPKFENTIAYIISELDEMEREDFYRIKMLQKKKKAAIKKAKAKHLEEEGAGDSHKPEDDGVPGSGGGGPAPRPPLPPPLRLRKCEMRLLAVTGGVAELPCMPARPASSRPPSPRPGSPRPPSPRVRPASATSGAASATSGAAAAALGTAPLPTLCPPPQPTPVQGSSAESEA